MATRPSTARLLLIASGLALAAGSIGFLLLRESGAGFPGVVKEEDGPRIHGEFTDRPDAVPTNQDHGSVVALSEAVPLASMPLARQSPTPPPESQFRASPASDERTWTVIAQDAAARPVADALVEVWASDQAAGAMPYDYDRPRIWDGRGTDPRPPLQPPATTGVTDAHGRCEIKLPSAEAVFLVSRGDVGVSGLWYAQAVWDSDPRITTVELLARGSIVGQVVRSDESPVSGAVVRFDSFRVWRDGKSGQGEPRLPGDVVTDADGRFKAEVDHRFMGEGQAFVGDSASGVGRVTWVGERDPVTLRFAGKFGIHGLVIDASGQPIPGVKISADRRLEKTVESQSAPDGRYSIELFEPGSYCLSAEWPNQFDWVMADPLCITLTEERPEVAHDIGFIRAAAISGRALWVDGTPAAASVTATPIERPDRPLSHSQALALNIHWFNEPKSPNEAADGRFRLGPIHPDFHYRLECYVDMSEGLVVEAEAVAPGTEDLEFVFDPAWRDGTTISGGVRDARTHNPIDAFTVSLLRYSDEFGPRAAIPMSPAPRARLEPNGRFSFPRVLYGSRYIVQVEAQGYGTQSVGPLDPRDGAAELTVEMQAVGSLRILVRSAEGLPVAGARIACLIPDSEPIPIVHFRRQLFADTAADGTLSFEDLVPGEYWVQAFTLDAASTSQAVMVAAPGPTPVNLELKATTDEAVLAVHVLDRFGQPVERYDVVASFPIKGPVAAPATWLNDTRTASTDRDGWCRFDALPAGVCTLYGGDPDLGIPQSQVVVLSADTPTSVELRLR